MKKRGREEQASLRISTASCSTYPQRRPMMGSSIGIRTIAVSTCVAVLAVFSAAGSAFAWDEGEADLKTECRVDPEHVVLQVINKHEKHEGDYTLRLNGRDDVEFRGTVEPLGTERVTAPWYGPGDTWTLRMAELTVELPVGDVPLCEGTTPTPTKTPTPTRSPSPTPTAVTPTPTPTKPSLAQTGGNTGELAAVAGAILLAGGLVGFLGTRRHARRHSPELVDQDTAD
ncbi:LPXTG cell wall anchor domain-containing protein [Streptomyces sp. NPDC054841]